MKKIVFSIFFLFSFIATIYSQDEEYGLRLGFQLSPTLSWMDTDDNTVLGNGNNLGLRLGMMAEYYFRDKYAFTTGINFAFNQGGTLQHEEGGNLWSKSELSDSALNALPNGVNLGYHLQYLEIPFGLKMRTKEIGYFRYFAEIPLVSLGIRVQARGDVGGTDRLDSSRENIQEDVNLINLNWGFGGGLHYILSEDTELVFGLYYQQGFTDVTDNNAVKANGQREDAKGIIKSITLRLGILF